MPLPGPMGVALVLIYPCGKAWKNPPFPLAPDRAESVLAVKGSLRRFAPWTAPGRSEGMTVYEGKGGLGAGVMKGLEKFLTRDRDRELFGLDPMPESTPEGRT